jgi:phosphohistidine phosphatase
MQKILYLIRHAKSDWENPLLRDFDRPLSERGLRIAPQMANLLHNKVNEIDAFVSSPAERAFRTATYFAAKFGCEAKDILLEAAIYEASVSTLLHIVRNFDEKYNTICLFGHNPGFTDFANVFGSNFIFNIPTCGIIKIVGKSWQEFMPESGAQVTAQWFPKTDLKA